MTSKKEMTIEGYCCDTCGSAYRYKWQAENCEKGHFENNTSFLTLEEIEKTGCTVEDVEIINFEIQINPHFGNCITLYMTGRYENGMQGSLFADFNITMCAGKLIEFLAKWIRPSSGDMPYNLNKFVGKHIDAIEWNRQCIGLGYNGKYMFNQGLINLLHRGNVNE